MNFKYLKEDIRHFLVNLGESSASFLFYLKFGFYGWEHLLTVLIIQYTIMPFDDWIEGKRTFPYYSLPLVFIAFHFYPLVTFLAGLGEIVVNLQVILKRQNFLLERLEGLGNMAFYILPFTIPVGLHTWQLYVAATLFLVFADSFHKIGHRETKYEDLMWRTAFLSLAVLAIVFYTPTIAFYIALLTLLVSLIPFKTLRKKRPLYNYTQAWFGISGFVAFYYYLFFIA